MSRALGTTLFILGITVVPLLLGWLIIGGEVPVGRNTRSPTRVGHLALYMILEELGYRTRRFERGLETLPDERGVLVALEPGPALFRSRGRFAKGLVDWVAAGNAALVTLGPDPDRDAELDDEGGELGVKTKRAIQLAEAMRDRAKDRAAPRERPADPEEADEAEIQGELDPSDSWDAIHLFSLLGADDLLDERIGTPAVVSGPLAEDLAAGLEVTRPRAFSTLEGRPWPGEVLLEADGHPILIELSIGSGKLIVGSEPRLFHNAAIGRRSHGRIAVLAIDRLAAHARTDVVWFEEFSHGGREAGNLIDLAVGTRARWMVLQLLLVALAYILVVSRRERSIVPFEVPPRRSRDEGIDAMASLFIRANDSEGALRRLVDLTRQRLLGVLPPGSESALASLVASRTRRDAREIDALLSAARSKTTARELLRRARDLRSLRKDAES